MMAWADEKQQAMYVTQRDPANRLWLIDPVNGAKMVAGNLANRPSSVAVLSRGILVVSSDHQIAQVGTPQ